MKKIILITLCIAAVLVAAGCGKKESGTDAKLLQATVTKTDASAMLVTPIDGASELASSDCFSIPLDTLDFPVKPEIGDQVEVFYEGGICETYPATLEKITSVVVLPSVDTSTDVSFGGALSGMVNDAMEGVLELTEQPGYEEAGIVIQEDISVIGGKQWIYKGQAVAGLMDGRRVYTSDKGQCFIRVLRDADGNISDVAELSADEFQELMPKGFLLK